MWIISLGEGGGVPPSPSLREGVKNFLVDMSAKLPPSTFSGQKLKEDFFRLVLYIYKSTRNALKWTILIKIYLKKRVVADLMTLLIQKFYGSHTKPQIYITEKWSFFLRHP